MDVPHGGTDPSKYHLSEQELAVLRLLTEDLSDEEIASRLAISSNSASEIVGAVRLKLGTRSRTETAVRAIREGLILALILQLLWAPGFLT